jgi:orotidine-5'-phosphate decarboxylase
MRANSLAAFTALGPYIAVFKTHIDIISDFGIDTTEGLQELAKKHNFLIFEDRKFVDIGNTVQKQYRGGALRIYDWAHIINASVLAGEGIIDALAQTIEKGGERDRGILILAEMTSKGSLAVGEYTKASVEIAKKHKDHVLGFVATRDLSADAETEDAAPGEDFVIFTTGISISSTGDALGQQYQSPTSAMERGADFLIVGRGIYSGPDPITSARAYREAGWAAYLSRLKGST